MARADPGAVVAVEVLVKQDQVAPVWVALELLGATVDRSPPVAAAKEDPREPPRQLGGHLPEVELRPRARGAVHRERVSVERSEERRVGKEGRSRWSPYH